MFSKPLLHSPAGTPIQPNVSHTTETSSPYRSGAWRKGRCPISSSVTQKNCWLVAESNLEKKIQLSTQKYSTPSKLQNELKKIVSKSKKCFFLRKLTKMSNLILCFSEIPKTFIRVRVRQVAFFI